MMDAAKHPSNVPMYVQCVIMIDLNGGAILYRSLMWPIAHKRGLLVGGQWRSVGIVGM